MRSNNFWVIFVIVVFGVIAAATFLLGTSEEVDTRNGRGGRGGSSGGENSAGENTRGSSGGENTGAGNSSGNAGDQREYSDSISEGDGMSDSPESDELKNIHVYRVIHSG